MLILISSFLTYLFISWLYCHLWYICWTFFNREFKGHFENVITFYSGCKGGWEIANYKVAPVLLEFFSLRTIYVNLRRDNIQSIMFLFLECELILTNDELRHWNTKIISSFTIWYIKRLKAQTLEKLYPMIIKTKNIIFVNFSARILRILRIITHVKKMIKTILTTIIMWHFLIL